jgi:hypothetical protein
MLTATQSCALVVVMQLGCALVGEVCAQGNEAYAPTSGRRELELLPEVDAPVRIATRHEEFLPPPTGYDSYDVVEAIPAPHEHYPSPADTEEIDDPTLGPTLRVFEPKARVYFDTGWEAPDKLDIFHDGSLAPAINFFELFWQNSWGDYGQPDWRWGPCIGVGISSVAGDSQDGSLESSGAPVLMLSGGLQFEFPLASRRAHLTKLERALLPTAGVEFGYAAGISSDESLDYSADGAIYVGVSLHVIP